MSNLQGWILIIINILILADLEILIKTVGRRW